ncbi:MAG TPA: hypothetical protein VMS79_00070, partial [Methanomassiliicoccales archaeon]|nr:hypothetical protein [Methanomassiliicoccales archaeon]
MSRKGKGALDSATDDPPETSATNGSVEKTDDLRRWLSGDQSGLLDWLSEEGGQEIVSAPAEAVPESERIAEVRRTAELLKSETERLSELLPEMKEGRADAVALGKEQLKGVLELQEDLNRQIESLAKIDGE